MELTTERLLLRDFRFEDWPALLAYQSDPRYLQYYAWTTRTEADAKRFVEMFLNQQRAQPRMKFQLAVVLKANGEVIGNCGVRKESVDAHQADMGYELAPDHWGKGYATEATRAIVRFGFETLGLHRIRARCIRENTRSARVLEKLGMQREGMLRHDEYFKGRYWDTLLYGMLVSEWQAQHGA